jgi:SPP1 family holin
VSLFLFNIEKGECEMKNVDKGTIIRTAVLFLAIVNQVLAVMGKSPLPISSDQLTDLISTGFTAVTAIVAWWKNNDFSAAAREGTAHMKRLKAQAKEGK